MLKRVSLIFSAFLVVALLYVGSYFALVRGHGVTADRPFFGWFLHAYYPLRVLEARQQNPPRHHTGTIRSLDLAAHRLMLSGDAGHPNALALGFPVSLEPVLRSYHPGDVLSVTYELRPNTSDASL